MSVADVVSQHREEPAARKGWRIPAHQPASEPDERGRERERDSHISTVQVKGDLSQHHPIGRDIIHHELTNCV